MKNIDSYKSLMIAGILLALAALQGLNYYNYNRYNETIFKIQTVDFNIMSQILPTKLSTALIHHDERALTDSISNSNFSLFGIALTDCISESPECPEQKITHANWKHLLKVNPIKFSGQHYDVLRDPPPLHAEKRYLTFSGVNPKAVSLPNDNHGKIIGRVYYIRKLPDSFIDSQIYWLKSIFNFKFNDRYTYTNNFVFTIFIFGIAFLITLKIRRQDKALNDALLREAELQREAAELQREAEEFQRISAENKLLRLVSFNSTLSHVIDQEFSSVVANQLQKIDASIREIMLRTHVDIKDIIHDINKAPLLASAGSTDELLARINSQNTDSGIPSELTDFIADVNSSIKTIQWVLDDLKDIASLDSTLMDINTVLDDFKGKLPPTLTGLDWLNIQFDLSPEPLNISGNPHHITSIVKNALYNASAALKKSRRRQKSNKSSGWIKIKTIRHHNFGHIIITDNGPGIPEAIIERLYESQERINNEDGQLKGNGSIIVTAYLMFHSGRVKKRNLPEGGAEIVFIFPLSDKES